MLDTIALRPSDEAGAAAIGRELGHQQHQIELVASEYDCHMVLVDLRPKGVKGRDAERALERAGLTCNKNAIPFGRKSRS